jgi:selenide,water dikinase
MPTTPACICSRPSRRTFGQIAATNALSDVYAMGGRPLTSLALVCFPEKGDLEILERILAGGLSKMMEAGCTVIGGHSIRDDETKFGYSVTGVIHPQRVLANKGTQPGDRVLFTKSLGTGVISTAIKKGTAKQEWIDSAVKSMTTLNKTAADVITKGSVGPGLRPGQAELSSAGQPRAGVPTWFVHALTDVTGFGLIGHAREMALASNVSLVVHSAKIPLLDGALECVRAGNIPGGLTANRDFAECLVEYENGIPEEVKTLLFDPQTAGGLLITVASEDAVALTSALLAASVPAVEIGEVLPRTKPLIRITS